MKAVCISVVLLLVGCGSDERNADGGMGNDVVLTVGGTSAMCPETTRATGGKSSAADNVSQAMDLYGRCAARCDLARDQHCAKLDRTACVTYCLGWENRVANGLCVSEITDYISCREAISDPCAYPSGPVPQSCLATLVGARCCLGLTPYEDEPK